MIRIPMRLHYLVLYVLAKYFPKLFDRYFAEYKEAKRKIRKNVKS